MVGFRNILCQISEGVPTFEQGLFAIQALGVRVLGLRVLGLGSGLKTDPVLWLHREALSPRDMFRRFGCTGLSIRK